MSIAALEEAVALLADAPPSVAQARVQAGLALNVMLAGRNRESQPIAERAAAIARTIGAADVESHALSTLGVDRGSLGAVEEGTRLLERSLEMALSMAEPSAIGRAYTNLGTVQQMGGDLEGAAGRTSRGSRRAGGMATSAPSAPSSRSTPPGCTSCSAAMPRPPRCSTRPRSVGCCPESPRSTSPSRVRSFGSMSVTSRAPARTWRSPGPSRRRSRTSSSRATSKA